jgi:type IV pilus assembly protein PilN
MTLVKINLLPKQYSKRSGKFSLGKHGLYFILGAAGVMVLFGIITGWQLYKINELKGQIEVAQARTIQLQKDITLVDALIDIKVKITDRLEAVERLDRHRSAWVRILEDLSGNIPDFIWLSRFSEISKAPTAASNDTTAATQVQAQPQFIPAEIEGFSFTLNALASFMIKMMRSNYFDEVDLIQTEEIAIDKQKAYNFKVTCNVHYLSDEELEQIVAQEAAITGSTLN